MDVPARGISGIFTQMVALVDAESQFSIQKGIGVIPSLAVILMSAPSERACEKEKVLPNTIRTWYSPWAVAQGQETVTLVRKFHAGSNQLSPGAALTVEIAERLVKLKTLKKKLRKMSAQDTMLKRESFLLIHSSRISISSKEIPERY